MEEEVDKDVMNEEICNYVTIEEETFNNIAEDGASREVIEENIGDIRNIYQEKMEIRKMFHKTPIKKYDYQLEYDYETPQEERRRILLEHQKKSRDDAIAAARGILEDEFLSNTKSKKNMRKKRVRVMLSEWMLDVPENFIEEWMMIPCPLGKRTVLVASKGKTVAYTRKGLSLTTFRSALPGGNCKCHKSQYTIVDCIWVASQKTYYVLDVLAWGNYPTMLCEAECRRFLVNSQLKEIEELKEADHEINKYPILCLPHVNCDMDLSSALTEFGNQYSLDGLLFYHRKGYYRFGRSPLSVWLKPFMLPEVLGIFVPSPYDEKPDGYIDYKHYICEYTQNKQKKELLQNYFGIAMECS